MFRRDRLDVEPRLRGLLVTRAAGPLRTEWEGRLIPWRLVRTGPTLSIVDEAGEPEHVTIRQPTPGMMALISRAFQRAVTRDVLQGDDELLFRFQPRRAEQFITIVFGALAAYCVYSMVRALAGMSTFTSQPSPIWANRFIIAGMWLVYAAIPLIGAYLLAPAAFSPVREIWLRREGLGITTTSTEVLAWEDVEEIRSAFAATQIRTTLGRTYSIPVQQGLGKVLELAACLRDPRRKQNQQLKLRRTLIRSLIIWIVGCLVIIGTAIATGAGPQTSGNQAANIIALSVTLLVGMPLLIWLRLQCETRLVPWLAKRTERSRRAKLRLCRRPAIQPSPPVSRG